MNFLTLLLTAVGLSMDAFAVAVGKGLSLKKASLWQSTVVGLYFGGFQAAMPLLGFFIGCQFADVITAADHWIAFALLGFIGVKMIRESRETECEAGAPSLSFRAMLPLAIATSIDALAAGLSFACLKTHITPAVMLIGVTTFALSVLGVRLGRVFGARFKFHAELAGGIILVLMGLKILVEHTLLA